MKILVLNSGSSSVKYKLLDIEKNSSETLAEGGVEKIGLPDGFLKFKLASGEKEITELGKINHREAIQAILSNLTYRKNDVVIMDMEAGLEHLGRGTAANMDQFIVVIEPGARSVQTYHNVKRLASDLGVKQVRVVANKVRDQQDEDFVRSAIPAEDFLGVIHYNPQIIDADRQGKSPYDFSPTAIEEIRKIKAILDRDER